MNDNNIKSSIFNLKNHQNIAIFQRIYKETEIYGVVMN